MPRQSVADSPYTERKRWGGGEMPPATLFRTTLDPLHRRLDRVHVAEADKLVTECTISDLMGKDSSARFDLVMNQAHEAGDLDI